MHFLERLIKYFLPGGGQELHFPTCCWFEERSSSTCRRGSTCTLCTNHLNVNVVDNWIVTVEALFRINQNACHLPFFASSIQQTIIIFSTYWDLIMLLLLLLLLLFSVVVVVVGDLV